VKARIPLTVYSTRVTGRLTFFFPKQSLGYGANDDAAAAVRFLMPFIPRSELARLARCGLLVTTTPIGSANASPMRALGETASTSDTAVGDFANSAAARRTRDATKEHEKDTYAKLASRHTCVSAVVVATFDGFLELERRAAAEGTSPHFPNPGRLFY
jgi:hypothetical protein|tara:strand:+ start:71 stop:544 length:474 start_codon:yes stop_codon:yes gene_type:complete